jgi:hypothetical protein
VPGCRARRCSAPSARELPPSLLSPLGFAWRDSRRNPSGATAPSGRAPADADERRRLRAQYSGLLATSTSAAPDREPELTATRSACSTCCGSLVRAQHPPTSASSWVDVVRTGGAAPCPTSKHSPGPRARYWWVEASPPPDRSPPPRPAPPSPGRTSGFRRLESEGEEQPPARDCRHGQRRRAQAAACFASAAEMAVAAPIKVRWLKA